MKKGEQTRQRMIEATASLLQSQGYAGTGVAQIIDEAGAPRGSLYFHFPGGKEELAAAAVRQSGAEWRVAIMEAVGAARDLPAGIRAACKLLADDLADSGFEHGCPVATVALEAAPRSDVLHQACAEVYAAWQEIIEARLRALGLPAARAARLATSTLAMIEGAVLLCKAQRSTRPLEHVGAELSELVGLLGRG
ncbi:MAG TPA: TetR/AcrR family transcriptional regulator [Kofleriaceae bacterium]|nr:TetR/AcrR family transcriptional regulator [Kofleriaceae bacterium]